MTWIYLVYLLGLLYFATNQNRIVNKKGFRLAWIWFAIIPLSQFVFTLFRAGNSRSSGDLLLIEMWAEGIAQLLFGISLILMLGALVTKDSEDAEQGGGGQAATRSESE
jgi:hypothetical protein